MARSDFIAADGTVWHIFAGLPANYPDTGDRAVPGGAQAGLTFRAETGEIRVLPRAAIPRTVQLPPNELESARQQPALRPDTPDWEDLLQRALVWPRA